MQLEVKIMNALAEGVRSYVVFFLIRWLPDNSIYEIPILH